MLATLAGFLALLLGLMLLLLPLVVSELSRPRDSAWGAVVLLLGLVLVTSAERLTGAPMLAVLCAGLLVGRLGGEVAQGRWCALSDEERQALRSAERWSRSLNQLAAVAASLLQSALDLAAAFSAWLAERRQGRSHGKRWVRSDTPALAAPAEASGVEGGQPAPAEPPSSQDAPPPQAAPAEFKAGSGAMPASAADSQAIADAGSDEGPAASVPAAAAAASAILVETSGPAAPAEPTASASASADPGVRIVSDFSGVDALLAAAPESGAGSEAAAPPLSSDGPPPPSPADA